MNLHNQLPANIYVITTGTTTHSAPVNGKFFSVTCTAAGTLKVKGGGEYAFIDASASGSGHIDPTTGLEFTGNTSSDGFYEKLSTSETDIPMIAGQTIYGRFDTLKSDGTFTGFAYAG